MENKPITQESDIDLSAETVEKIKELSSFSTNPERTLSYLENTARRNRQVFYRADLNKIISSAKTVLARGGNLLSPESIESLLDPEKYNQDESSRDRLTQSGKDFVQAAIDNRNDRISSTGDDDGWKVGQQKIGIHDAVSDTARVSGFSNYNETRDDAATDEDDQISVEEKPAEVLEDEEGN